MTFLLKLWYSSVILTQAAKTSHRSTHSWKSANKIRLQVKRRFQHLILSCVKPLEDMSQRTEKQLQISGSKYPEAQSD